MEADTEAEAGTVIAAANLSGSTRLPPLLVLLLTILLLLLPSSTTRLLSFESRSLCLRSHSNSTKLFGAVNAIGLLRFPLLTLPPVGAKSSARAIQLLDGRQPPTEIWLAGDAAKLGSTPSFAAVAS